MASKSREKEIRKLWDETKRLYDNYEYDKALIPLDKIDELTKKHSVPTEILMKSANTRGAIHSYNSDYKNAEKYFLLSLDYAKQIGNPGSVSIRYDNLAGVYIHTDRYNEAIDCLETSRRLKEQNNLEKDLPATLLNLANIYSDLRDIEALERTLKECIFYTRKYNYTRAYPLYHYGMGLLFILRKDHKNARKEYNKCIRFALSLNDFVTAAKAFSNIGNSYLELKEWGQAKKEFTGALKLAKQHNIRGVELMASIQLGVIANQQGDTASAIELCRYVESNITTEDFDLMHRDLAELKSHISESQGQYKEALESNKKYLEYYTKEYDNEMSRSIQSLQAKYDAEKKDRALEKAKLLQAQSELKALRAQMDPHFIFNALNSMRKELLVGNVDGADAYLVRFSKLLRLILDTTRTPDIKLSDNIELLHLYIQIEQNRQGNRFDYSIKTKGVDPDSTYIPGLILQPLAENAIVHGLYHKKNGQGKLQITFSKTKQALVIKVRDNGVGRLANKDKAKAGHTSHAMAIIRETLDLTWQGRGVKNYFTVKDLMTKDNINIGTEVTVLLPLS